MAKKVERVCYCGRHHFGKSPKCGMCVKRTMVERQKREGITCRSCGAGPGPNPISGNKMLCQACNYQAMKHRVPKTTNKFSEEAADAFGLTAYLARRRARLEVDAGFTPVAVLRERQLGFES